MRHVHTDNGGRSLWPKPATKVIEKDNWDYSRAGWSGGAMVLGKLPVPGRPTNLD